MPGGPGILFDPSVSRQRSRSSIRTSATARPSRPSPSVFFGGDFSGFSGSLPKVGKCFVSGLVARGSYFFVFWPNGSVSSGFGFGSFFGSGFWGGVAVRFLSLVVFRFWFGLCCCLASLHLFLHRKTALPGIRPQRRLPPVPPPIGLSGVTRLLLGVVPWTSRSVAGWECRRLVTPPILGRTRLSLLLYVPAIGCLPQRTQAVSSAPGFFGGFLFFVCNTT